MPLQENSAHRRLYQPLPYFLVYIKRLTFLNMKIQNASVENVVTYEHCVILVHLRGQRGICHAEGIFHYLTHFTHLLPHCLSLRKITGSKVT